MGKSAAEGPKREGEERSKRWRVRLLLVAALLGALFGWGAVGQPLEDLLRSVRNVAHPDAASGDVVIAAIDDQSLEEVAHWPWPRRHHAQIIDNLRERGAQRIFVDIDFSSRSAPRDDQALAMALARADGAVTLAVRSVADPVTGALSHRLPLPSFRNEAELAHINLYYNYRGEAWRLPHLLNIEGQDYPSFAAELATLSNEEEESFPLDYSLNPATIPVISAVDILKGRVSPQQVAGKTVIVGTTSPELGDLYLVPGHGYLPGVYLHVFGAETLKAGPPVDWGWIPPFMLALLLAGGLAFAREIRAAMGCAVGFVIFLLVPLPLEQQLIFVDVVPALLALFVVGAAFGWSRFQSFYKFRGSIKAVSGLPNFNALRHESTVRNLPLIVLRIRNYPEIMSMLSDAEEALVRQIVNRLNVVSVASEIYQGDEGLFAWFAHPSTERARGEQLDALYEIFRSPFIVQDRLVDPVAAFGVDLGVSRSVSNRLGSALFAADEALSEGLKWKQYDPSTRADSSWKLSLLSQLDQAIDTGHLSIAYQPKLEISSGSIVGAEALVRWHHPERGILNPADFILAAEQNGRIEKLTRHVLRLSIEAAAQAQARGIPFNVAVNLSAKLINDMSLAGTVAKLLREFHLPADRLTLEITETAALAGSGGDLALLMELRDMGVALSIDDYGTGMSTLAYLKRVPATEIKIDQSFIQSIETNPSDRLLVASTIQLAHALGQKVVAEGVERKETLAALAELECDLAQGYLIGRPMPLSLLQDRLVAQRKAA